MLDRQTELLSAARDASLSSYSPYSGFAVGAALLSKDGRIYRGANVENASYGLTICAERVAFANAALAGVRAFAALAVYSPAGVTPCGMCRQTLIEFGGDFEVTVGGPTLAPRTFLLSALLPEAFVPKNLGVLPEGE